MSDNDAACSSITLHLSHACVIFQRYTARGSNTVGVFVTLALNREQTHVYTGIRYPCKLYNSNSLPTILFPVQMELNPSEKQVIMEGDNLRFDCKIINQPVNSQVGQLCQQIKWFKLRKFSSVLTMYAVGSMVLHIERS